MESFLLGRGNHLMNSPSRLEPPSVLLYALYFPVDSAALDRASSKGLIPQKPDRAKVCDGLVVSQVSRLVWWS
jgi:hypothetical protein